MRLDHGLSAHGPDGGCLLPPGSASASAPTAAPDLLGVDIPCVTPRIEQDRRMDARRKAAQGVTARLEFKKGSLHNSHVCMEFVAGVGAVLSDEVFAELDGLTPDRVESWAERHGVNAPCIVEAFASYCSGGWAKYGRSDRDRVWDGPEIPTFWLEIVRWLNKLPLNSGFWRGVFTDLDDLTEEERRARRRSDPNFSRTRVDDPFLSPDAVGRCLPPIATDPARESLEEFEIRARLHWKGRAMLATHLGARESGQQTEWRNMRRDIGWLVRYQVKHETYDDIAAADGIGGAHGGGPETVKKAIDRVARMVGLKRPHGGAAKAARTR